MMSKGIFSGIVPRRYARMWVKREAERAAHGPRKDHEQEVSPTTEHKVELALLNLGLQKLVLNTESNVQHIH